jgi:DNA-binding NarL/FixJ family response regulator
MGTRQTIRIVIADDHAIVREGLKRIVASADDLDVVGEAKDGTEVLQRVRELTFDVLMLDLSMPGRNGMEMIKLIRADYPKLHILILSMHQELQYAVRAIQSGASGYLTKESAPEQLVQAIRKIASGGAYVSAEVAEQLALRAMPGSAALPHEKLTAREFEVLQLLVAGISVTAIAAQINLSVKTISTHKANLLDKMGLQNQSELVRYAIRHGLGEK